MQISIQWFYGMGMDFSICTAEASTWEWIFESLVCIMDEKYLDSDLNK